MSTFIRKVGTLGIGLMGSGIAQVAAANGFDVLVVDTTPELLRAGMERIAAIVRRLAEAHKKSGGQHGIAPEEERNILGRLRTSTDRGALLECDIIVEAVTRNDCTDGTTRQMKMLTA